jgi:hypothetical protein
MAEQVGAPHMPDLVRASRGFHHTLDSALRTLRKLGVEGQVLLESAGPGWPSGYLVEQAPAAGEPLTPGTPIVLSIAGAGGFHKLPFAMRTVTTVGLTARGTEDDGISREAGADSVLAPVDDQVLKLIHQVRHAAGYLDLHPDRPRSALRWLQRIFDYRPDGWPAERWYRLARLFGLLHRLAGRADGVRLACLEVFGLEVVRVDPAPHLVPLPEESVTRLGRRASRLGVDAVAGRGIEALAGVQIVFSVRSAAEYRRFDQPEEVAQRLALYALILPAFLDLGAVTERWKIGDPAEGARAGGGRAAALGQGSYLGSATPTGAIG